VIFDKLIQVFVVGYGYWRSEDHTWLDE